MLRFIIDTSKCNPASKCGVIVQWGLMRYLLTSWEYFLHKQKEDISIQVGKAKVTIYTDSMYNVICNDLLMIQRKYPECLKMGKKATQFLENYKNIIYGKG